MNIYSNLNYIMYICGRPIKMKIFKVITNLPTGYIYEKRKTHIEIDGTKVSV